MAGHLISCQDSCIFRAVDEYIAVGSGVDVLELCAHSGEGNDGEVPGPQQTKVL